MPKISVSFEVEFTDEDFDEIFNEGILAYHDRSKNQTFTEARASGGKAVIEAAQRIARAKCAAKPEEPGTRIREAAI